MYTNNAATTTTLPPFSDLFLSNQSKITTTNTTSAPTTTRSPVLDIANLLSSPPSPPTKTQHYSQRDLKAKRKRASPNQLIVLNRVFNQTYFPSTEIRIELGKQLGMSPRTVQIWFQNKRQALRSRGRQDSPPSSSFYLPPISPPRSPPTDLYQSNYSLPPLRLVSPQYSPSMSYPSPNSMDRLCYRDF